MERIKGFNRWIDDAMPRRWKLMACLVAFVIAIY